MDCLEWIPREGDHQQSLPHASKHKEGGCASSRKKAKFVVTETVPEVCYEERTTPGNNRSEYQALNLTDAEHRRVHQEDHRKVGLHDLWPRRALESSRGRHRTWTRGGRAPARMLAKHKTLGGKHEELSQLQAEQEKGTPRTKMFRREPLIKLTVSS